MLYILYQSIYTVKIQSIIQAHIQHMYKTIKTPVYAQPSLPVFIFYTILGNNFSPLPYILNPYPAMQALY